MANKHDIQHSILEMQAKRAKLGIKKAELQSLISENREMLRFVSQGCETFTELVAKKNLMIAELKNIDLEIIQIKQDIKKRQLLKDEVEEMEQPREIVLVAEITVLRDMYLKFAGDKTRINSMRLMAAEFAQHLTKILKKQK